MDIEEIRLDKSKVTHLVIRFKSLDDFGHHLKVAVVYIFVGEKEVKKLSFNNLDEAIRYCDISFPNVDFKL